MVGLHSKDSVFARWLRTGVVPRIRSPEGVELKFNPWHDPTNGQFSFAHAGDYHAAKARRWTGRRENAEIHDYVRLKKLVAERAERERRGEADWAQQGKDFAGLYAEAVAAEATGAVAAKYVIAPAIRAAAPTAKRLLRPEAYARDLAASKPLPPAPEPVWVDENAWMSDRARNYNDSAVGARSNPATRRGQAPALYRTLDDGSKRAVRFDGYEDGVFIDRKISITLKPDAKARALKQSQVLRENNALGRWEVPDEKAKKAAKRLLKLLDIDNIGVKVVPE